MRICEHLMPIFEHEQRQKNIVREKSYKGWEKIDLFIYFKNPMDVEYEKSMNLDECVKYHEDPSPHYRFNGFWCEKCKHSLAGPLK